MVSQVTFNRDKWIAAMMLDPVTGLDPPGSKIRAAEGIGAASSFMTGYWIWYVFLCNVPLDIETNRICAGPRSSRILL
jgi:phospholipid:diacylglycerol acyltransferase